MKLSSAELERLRQIDSPTIANAIELFGVRPRVSGFMGVDVKCMFPDLGVMVGYAVTVTCDSQSEDAHADSRAWWNVLNEIYDSPEPVVLVFQDVGPRPSHSCHFGDGMANVSKRLGAVGVVTNGGVRDLAGCREIGFHCFATGATVSHGNHRIVSSGEPVEVSGVPIETGNLIHADENGVVTIPADVSRDLCDVAEELLIKERESITFYRGTDFSLQEMARKLGISPMP